MKPKYITDAIIWNCHAAENGAWERVSDISYIESEDVFTPAFHHGLDRQIIRQAYPYEDWMEEYIGTNKKLTDDERFKCNYMPNGMTREEKEFLADLCARLPYSVKLKVREWKTPIELTTIRHNVLSGNYIINENYRLDDIKPYLRSMSSMTEEEDDEWYDFTYEKTITMEQEHSSSIDWLNAHHFDYRGLIEKGLAISTEVFNPYK